MCRQSVSVFCVCAHILLTYPGVANHHHVSKDLDHSGLWQQHYCSVCIIHIMLELKWHIHNIIKDCITHTHTHACMHAHTHTLHTSTAKMSLKMLAIFDLCTISLNGLMFFSCVSRTCWRRTVSATRAGLTWTTVSLSLYQMGEVILNIWTREGLSKKKWKGIIETQKVRKNVLF